MLFGFFQYLDQKLSLKTLLRTNFTRFADAPPTIHFTFWAGPLASEVVKTVCTTQLCTVCTTIRSCTTQPCTVCTTITVSDHVPHSHAQCVPLSLYQIMYHTAMHSVYHYHCIRSCTTQPCTVCTTITVSDHVPHSHAQCVPLSLYQIMYHTAMHSAYHCH